MRVGKWLIVGVFSLLMSGLPVSALAMPRGGEGRGFDRDVHGDLHGDFDRGFHRGFDFDRDFPGGVLISPYWGLGWGWNDPWFWGWPPYYPSTVRVKKVNYGMVDFIVKPGDTKVYVDQKYIGMVNELDHHEAYVGTGQHDIKLVAPNGKMDERSIFVPSGKEVKLEDTL